MIAYKKQHNGIVEVVIFRRKPIVRHCHCRLQYDRTTIYYYAVTKQMVTEAEQALLDNDLFELKYFKQQWSIVQLLRNNVIR